MEGGGGGGRGGERERKQINGKRRGAVTHDWRWLRKDASFQGGQCGATQDGHQRERMRRDSFYTHRMFLRSFLSVACTLISLNVPRFWVWTFHDPSPSLLCYHHVTKLGEGASRRCYLDNTNSQPAHKFKSLSNWNPTSLFSHLGV